MGLDPLAGATDADVVAAATLVTAGNENDFEKDINKEDDIIVTITNKK